VRRGRRCAYVGDFERQELVQEVSEENVLHLDSGSLLGVDSFKPDQRDRGENHLYTRLLSTSYPEMEEVVKAYAEKVPGVETTFVQYLLKKEVENILKDYSLDNIAIELLDTKGQHYGCT
jgi:hypothetical protein